jgi:long-subunit fatty acid transport protein
MLAQISWANLQLYSIHQNLNNLPLEKKGPEFDAGANQIVWVLGIEIKDAFKFGLSYKSKSNMKNDTYQRSELKH